MNITQVQIHLNRGSTSKVKAWADIILDDEFIVKGLAIREDATDHYYYVTMPYKIKVTNHDEVREDVAHPIRDKCRQYIETKVLDEYENVMTKITNNRDLQDKERAIHGMKPMNVNAEPIGL